LYHVWSWVSMITLQYYDILYKMQLFCWFAFSLLNLDNMKKSWILCALNFIASLSLATLPVTDISYVFYEAQDSALRLTVWNPAVIASVAVPNVYLARREAFTGTARYSASNGLQHNRYLILFGV
jgi:hypothetical protein